MSKRKVLFFLSPVVGGAQRVSVLFSKLLDTSQYEVIYAIVGEAKSSIMDFLPQGAIIKQIKIRNIYDFTTFKIITLLKHEKPYAVFCSQMYLNNRIILAAKIIGGIKVVIRSNSMAQNLKSVRIDFVMAKKLYKYADRVVAQTPEMRDEILSIFNVSDKKTIVLYNPFDNQLIEEKAQQPSPYVNKSETRFICVGRIAPVKGYEIAIAALHKVVNKIPDAHLYIIGGYDSSSDYYKSLIQTLKEYGITERVHFEGYTDNPYNWMKNSDVFLLTSHIEGLPNALIEALYLQIPVVATRCVPIVERIVKPGINGYVVDCGDYEGMAKYMEKAVHLSSVSSFFTGASGEEINRLFEFNLQYPEKQNKQ